METDGSRKRVVIAGGGLAGLAAAKQLLEAGFAVDVYEKRDVLGGKWSSWQDEDGDWIETGLHVFFGAYEEIFNLMRDIGVYDRIQWKEHVLTYTLDGGERFEFRTLPAPGPFHLLPAVFQNRYFKLGEKATLAKALVPILFGSDKYYAEQDRISYREWHRKWGIADRMLSKMFLPMTLALKFLKPEDISARVVLDVSGMFLRKDAASRMGFLQGAPEVHLTGPLARHVSARGARIHTGAAVRAVNLGPDGQVASLTIVGPDGEWRDVTADYFLLALPIHNLKRLIPDAVRPQDYWSKLQHLDGVPVITVHLWADRQISGIDNVLFSPDGIIPVYADMANTTPDYRDPATAASPDRPSRFQFVVAPATDLMACSDQEIVARVWADVCRLFPDTAPAARIRKSKVVRVPQSVYWPKPGHDQYRVPQATPQENLFLAGGYTIQRFYDSMEGAVRSGNRAAGALIARERNEAWQPTP